MKDADWGALESSLESLQRYLGSPRIPANTSAGVLSLLSPSELQMVALGVQLALETVRSEHDRRGDTRPLPEGRGPGG